MARSRRLGIAGEVSAGPDPEVHKKSAAVTQFSRSRFFSDPVFFARIRTGVFLIGKTIIGRFSNKTLLEQRPVILFRIRSCARPNSCDKRAWFAEGATWAGIFFYTEIADLCRLGFIYTEFAGRLRVRRMARIWMVATRLGFSVHRDRGFVEIGLYLHRDCRCIGRCGTRSEMTLLFSSQMQAKFRRRFRVVFS